MQCRHVNLLGLKISHLVLARAKWEAGIIVVSKVSKLAISNTCGLPLHKTHKKSSHVSFFLFLFSLLLLSLPLVPLLSNCQSGLTSRTAKHEWEAWNHSENDDRQITSTQTKPKLQPSIPTRSRTRISVGWLTAKCMHANKHAGANFSFSFFVLEAPGIQ